MNTLALENRIKQFFFREFAVKYKRMIREVYSDAPEQTVIDVLNDIMNDEQNIINESTAGIIGSAIENGDLYILEDMNWENMSRDSEPLRSYIHS